jgi:DNA-3-methyladenine glycosylase I
MKKAPLRCPWVDPDKPDYVAYHDAEWGVPVHDDRLLFEFLTLEAAQAGLSWYTVLRKRENYRAAFDGFDPVKVARYDARKVERLMADAGIIRNRAKILAAINNAKRFLEVRAEFGTFDSYLWGFVGGKPKVNRLRGKGDYRATSPESDAMSKDLRRRGFKFVGSTICYAHMQATGMVNDHILSCFRHEQVGAKRRRSPR